MSDGEILNQLKAEGVKKLILDLRNNGGGVVTAAVEVAREIVPKGKIIDVKYRDSKMDSTYQSTIDKAPFEIVTLVNGNTASAAELFAGALRDYNEMGVLRSTSVGKTSFGKGIMQSTLTFRDGSALTLTTALYNSPKGTNFHGVGVVPAVEANDGDDFIALAVAELEKMMQNIAN